MPTYTLHAPQASWMIHLMCFLSLVFLQTQSWHSTTTCTVWATGERLVTVDQTTALVSSGCSQRWGPFFFFTSHHQDSSFRAILTFVSYVCHFCLFVMFPPECCGDGERGEGQERQAEAQEAEAAAGRQTHARVLLFLLWRGRRAGDVWQKRLSESVPPAVSQPHQAAIW